MYLAEDYTTGKRHFVLRESYSDENELKSRDLISLGENPGRYIKYIDSRSFYIDETIEDKLDNLEFKPETPYTQEDLETIFWPFIRPDIKRRYTFVQSKHKKKKQDRVIKASEFHLFDRRRTHFLRFGQMNQGSIYKTNPKLFQSLHGISRDEIEQQFIRKEQILSPSELKSYVYVIFNLHYHFHQTIAIDMPQGLDQHKVDKVFLREICKLNQDKGFWSGMNLTDYLHPYLRRYLIMFIDNQYARSRYLDDILQDWINSRRDFSFPIRNRQEALDKGSTLFGVSRDTLKSMSARDLTRLYRKKAMEFHPDSGGKQEDFVELTHIYQSLKHGK